MELKHMIHEAGEGSPTEPMGLPPYPYGLRLHLTHAELEKLGFAELPPAGTEIHLEARGIVTRSATEDPDADGDVDYCCVEIQVTHLCCEEGEELEDEEDEDDEGPAHRLYGKKESA